MTILAAGKGSHGFGQWELESWDGHPYIHITIEEDYDSFTHDVSLDYHAAQTLHAALGTWLTEHKATP